MPWCTVWIFLFDAVVESHFFYGALNLYVMGVMMEESCSTTRHKRKEYVCYVVMFASVQVSSCRRRRMTPLLRWRKKYIFDLCDSLFFYYLILHVTHKRCLLFSDEYRMQGLQRLKAEQTGCSPFLRSYSNACINVCFFYHFTHEFSRGNLFSKFITQQNWIEARQDKRGRGYFVINQKYCLLMHQRTLLII